MVPENIKANIRRYRERHKALGLCGWCPNPVLPGRRYCKSCQQRFHDDYVRRAGPRTCVDCGVEIPRVFGEIQNRRCPPCKKAHDYEKHRLLWVRQKRDPRYMETHRAAAVAFQRRMKASGRCVQCGTLRDIPGILCGACREKRTGRKPWEPGRAGQQPKYQPNPTARRADRQEA